MNIVTRRTNTYTLSEDEIRKALLDYIKHHTRDPAATSGGMTVTFLQDESPDRKVTGASVKIEGGAQ